MANNKVDREYFRLLNLILEKGKLKSNRTGINTIGVFGEQAKFDVNLDAFPILTTKKVFWRGIVHELLWFISGSTNIKYLVDNDVHIWDEWAYAKYKKDHRDSTEHDAGSQKIEDVVIDQESFIKRIKNDREFALQRGELGEGTYGGMWRAFPYADDMGVPLAYGEKEHYYSVRGVDQLQKVIDKLKNNPEDRRIIVSAWHPYWVDHCALPPCHCLFHFNTEELTLQERLEMSPINEISGYGVSEEQGHKFFDGFNIPRRRLNCLLYQRSCDTFLGVPFNISSYCLLTAMIAHVTNMIPGTFTHTYGDLHIYENHLEQVKLQLTREPMELPKLWLNPEVKSLFDFRFDDIKLMDYNSHPAIKGEVAV
jgi:thymidylate synthase